MLANIYIRTIFGSEIKPQPNQNLNLMHQKPSIILLFTFSGFQELELGTGPRNGAWGWWSGQSVDDWGKAGWRGSTVQRQR